MFFLGGFGVHLTDAFEGLFCHGVPEGFLKVEGHPVGTGEEDFEGLLVHPLPACVVQAAYAGAKFEEFHPDFLDGFKGWKVHGGAP